MKLHPSSFILLTFALVQSFAGCSTPPEQYFYTQNFAEVQNRRVPPRTFFGPGDVPTVVVSGADYYGHTLEIEISQQLPSGGSRLMGTPKKQRLQTPKSFCVAYGRELAAGVYTATLLVDGRAARSFEFRVAK